MSLLFLVEQTAHAAPTADVTDAALSAVDSVCSWPPPEPSSSDLVVEFCNGILPCASRGPQLTCLAENDALLQQDPERAKAKCCGEGNNDGNSSVYIRWPRNHVEAALALWQAGNKTMDFTFSGGIEGGSNVNRSREWVVPFATKYFTPNSIFVDTSADVETYEVLNAIWDQTLLRAEDAFVPRNTEEKACDKSTCDPKYLQDLAEAQFALAPAGDEPWSMRFFEAIMSGAIPILEDTLHAGRSQPERALGYYYFLRSDVEAILDGGGTLPYCTEWVEANLRIFLQYQAWVGAPTDPSKIQATTDGCL